MQKKSHLYISNTGSKANIRWLKPQDQKNPPPKGLRFLKGESDPFSLRCKTQLSFSLAGLFPAGWVATLTCLQFT